MTLKLLARLKVKFQTKNDQAVYDNEPQVLGEIHLQGSVTKNTPDFKPVTNGNWTITEQTTMEMDVKLIPDNFVNSWLTRFAEKQVENVITEGAIVYFVSSGLAQGRSVVPVEGIPALETAELVAALVPK